MSAFFEFRGVTRRFIRRDGMFAEPLIVDAVKQLDLTVSRGETLGLVGESGCGKSTLARMGVRLLPPSSGDILLEGESLFGGSPSFINSLPRRIQMVFQDPYSSFNPRMKVGDSVGEALSCLGASRSDIQRDVAAMFAQVGLEPAHAARYPHEFSGGQRQRLAIARALVTRPDFVVCDEPVSSLDASVQAQVLGLLKDLQDSLSLTYLFISHDLAVISHMSDRVAVMHQGRIVELAATADLFEAPLHPYTRALLAAVPAVASSGLAAPLAAPACVDAKKSSGEMRTAQAPTPRPDADGHWNCCLYFPVCPHAMAVCESSAPALSAPAAALHTNSPDIPVSSTHAPAHRVRCHLYA